MDPDVCIEYQAVFWSEESSTQETRRKREKEMKKVCESDNEGEN